MKHPVKTISTKSILKPELLAIAKDNNPWIPYYNFMAKPVPHEVLNQDPFFDWLKDRYEYIGGIIRMNKFEQYDWHVDTRRGVGINMLLSHGKSFVYFTETPNELVKSVYPHKYQDDTYYLFNTQVPHCVINLDQPRYLFTIEFALDKTHLTFDQLRQDIKENYDRTT